MNRMYKLIREMCMEQKISDAELSRRIGIRHGLLSDLKSHDDQVLRTDNLKKIADYFNVPIEYFLDPGEPSPSDIPPEEPITDSQLLFALYGEVPEEIDDADIADIKRYADMVRLRKIEERRQNGPD